MLLFTKKSERFHTRLFYTINILSLAATLKGILLEKK